MHRRLHLPTRALVVFPLAAIAALALLTGTAMASSVLIVTQGEIPAKAPRKVQYFHTIQAAVNASKRGDYVLIEPGTYDEEVKVARPHSHIWIRGMNRNTVILDGQHKGGNGIEIYKDDDVWVENLTVRNFEESESCGDEECGNEIWWNGGSESGKIGAHGWFGRYLTAYDTGMDGGYGIFTGNETEGSWENIYSSGMDDSGIYLGACRECKARISNATMEDDAVGYSGSNSGGNLIIENSVFRDNRAGHRAELGKPGRPAAALERRVQSDTTVPAAPQKAAEVRNHGNPALHHLPRQPGGRQQQPHRPGERIDRRRRLGAWAWSSPACTETRRKTTRSRATSTTGSSGSSTRTPSHRKKTRSRSPSPV